MASKTLDHQQQMTVLDQSKTLAESALQMLYAAKEGGGNPKVQLLCVTKGLLEMGKGRERAGGAEETAPTYCTVRGYICGVHAVDSSPDNSRQRVETLVEDRIPAWLTAS